MNGAEQVARFSATQKLEKRLEDLELVVTEMAAQIVNDRVQLDKQHQELIDAVNLGINTALNSARERHVGLAEAFLAFEHQSLWQRLRWAVRGA